MEDTKICKKCGVEQSTSNFYIDKNNKLDGLRPYCKDCNKIINKKSYIKNKVQQLAASKIYRENHKEELAEKQKIRHIKNKDRYCANRKEAYKNNPYKGWANHTVSNHKRLGYIVQINKKHLEELARNAKYCNICGIELNWNYGRKEYSRFPSLDRMDNDSIVMLCNIQIICYKCNITKQNRTMEEFIEYCKMVAKKFGD